MTSDNQIREALTRLGSRKVIELDLETTGIDPILDHVLLIALDEVVLLAPRVSWVAALKPLLESPKVCKIIQGAHFDSMFLQREGIAPRNVVCTEAGARLLRLGIYSEKGTFSLVNLLDKALGIKIDPEWKRQMQLSFVGQDPETFYPTDEQLDYVCGDTAHLKALAAWEKKQLAERGLLDVWKIENGFTQVLASMQLHGMPFDAEAYLPIIEETEKTLAEVTARLSEQLTPQILEVRRQKFEAEAKVRQEWESLYAEASNIIADQADELGFATKAERRKYIQIKQSTFRELKPRPAVPKFDSSPINLNSGPQLTAALAELGIRPPDLERGTLLRMKASTPAKWHQLLDDLAEYSRLEKLLSSYGRSLLERVHPDGRLRSRYELIATGRISSAKWTDKGRGIDRGWNSQNAHPKTKKCVLAPAGRSFVVADYAQIELRVAAEMILRHDHTAKDNLVKSFRDGMDPHSLMTQDAFAIPYDEVEAKKDSDEKIGTLRKAAKTTNFSTVFGISPGTLAIRIYAARGSKGPFGKAQQEEAKKMVKTFWKGNPTLRKVLDGYAKQALDLGYTATLSGRRRLYKKLRPGSAEWHSEKGQIERASYNQPIQGTAADIVKVAAILVFYELAEKFPTAFIANAVHDELVTEQDEADEPAIKEIVKRCCHKAFSTFLKYVPSDPDQIVAIGGGKQWKH